MILVIANAVVQAAIVLLDHVLADPALAFVLGAGSAAVLIVAVWQLWGGARGLAWSAALGAVTAVVAVVFPYAVPLVVVAACALLAAQRSGSVAATLRAAGRSAAGHPARTAVLAVLTVLAVVLCWVVSALFGLLLAGAISSLATWIVIGVVAVLLQRSWAALARRAP